MDKDCTFIRLRYKLGLIPVKCCDVCAAEQVGQVGNIETCVEKVHDLREDALHFRR